MTSTATLQAPVIDFEKVDTQNGFDFYAIWDAHTNAWVDGTWIRVPQGASIDQVEDAFYRNETVSGI